MSEAVLGLVGVGVLVAAVFAVDLLLTRRQRRRIAAGGAAPGSGDPRRANSAANSARTGSRANGMSSTTYLG